MTNYKKTLVLGSAVLLAGVALYAVTSWVKELTDFAPDFEFDDIRDEEW